MPNGGSDCCGTCFNSKNKEEQGHHGAEKEGIVKCIIRNIKIPDPFWTYCTNHPHHFPKKLDVPLGPVYVTTGHPYSREIWLQPPDNEKIRTKLLEFLDNMDLFYIVRYPSPTSPEKIIMKQLAALKEKRALPKLLKIIRFDSKNLKTTKMSTISDKCVIVGHAIEALLEISEGEYLSYVEHFMNFEIDDSQNQYDQDTDDFISLRYHLISGLQHCNQTNVLELLNKGKRDPHSAVQKIAEKVIKKKYL